MSIRMNNPVRQDFDVLHKAVLLALSLNSDIKTQYYVGKAQNIICFVNEMVLSIYLVYQTHL